MKKFNNLVIMTAFFALSTGAFAQSEADKTPVVPALGFKKAGDIIRPSRLEGYLGFYEGKPVFFVNHELPLGYTSKVSSKIQGLKGLATHHWAGGVVIDLSIPGTGIHLRPSAMIGSGSVNQEQRKIIENEIGPLSSGTVPCLIFGAQAGLSVTGILDNSFGTNLKDLVVISASVQAGEDIVYKTNKDDLQTENGTENITTTTTNADGSTQTIQKEVGVKRKVDEFFNKSKIDRMSTMRTTAGIQINAKAISDKKGMPYLRLDYITESNKMRVAKGESFDQYSGATIKSNTFIDKTKMYQITLGLNF